MMRHLWAPFRAAPDVGVRLRRSYLQRRRSPLQRAVRRPQTRTADSRRREEVHVNPSQPAAGQLVGLDEPQGLVLRDRFQCWKSLKQGQQFLAPGEVPARQLAHHEGVAGGQPSSSSAASRSLRRRRWSIQTDVSTSTITGHAAAQGGDGEARWRAHRNLRGWRGAWRSPWRSTLPVRRGRLRSFRSTRSIASPHRSTRRRESWSFACASCMPY